MEDQNSHIRPISVEILSKLALKIEANKALQESTKTEVFCTYCNRKGHLTENCYLKNNKRNMPHQYPRKNLNRSQTNYNFNKKMEQIPNQQTTNTNSYRSTVICHNCGMKGHYSNECLKPRKNKNQTQKNPTAKRVVIKNNVVNVANDVNKQVESRKTSLNEIQTLSMIPTYNKNRRISK